MCYFCVRNLMLISISYLYLLTNINYKLEISMNFSKMAITLGVVSAFTMGSAQANDYDEGAFSLFIGANTFSQANQASDSIEIASPSSWTVTSRVPRQICMQWDGEQILKQPESVQVVVERDEDIERPGRRCIRWETVYQTVNHGKATRYAAYNGSKDRQVIVIQPYYFSMDGASLTTSEFYSMVNRRSLASRLRNSGYNQ